jgi:hypothetical protein
MPVWGNNKLGHTDWNHQTDRHRSTAEPALSIDYPIKPITNASERAVGRGTDRNSIKPLKRIKENGLTFVVKVTRVLSMRHPREHFEPVRIGSRKLTPNNFREPPPVQGGIFAILDRCFPGGCDQDLLAFRRLSRPLVPHN